MDGLASYFYLYYELCSLIPSGFGLHHSPKVFFASLTV